MQERRTRLIIVSESSLLSAAVKGVASGSFAHVLRFSHAREVVVDEHWDETVLIIETSDPASMVKSLTALREKGDLSRTIVLLRAHQRFEQFYELIGHAGAILPDTTEIEEVGMVANLVRHGISLLPSPMLEEMRATLADTAPLLEESAHLTEREEDVLSLIAEGRSNKHIAHHLHIGDSTVRVHVRSVLRKLGLQNRTQAALFAVGRRKRNP